MSTDPYNLLMCDDHVMFSDMLSSYIADSGTGEFNVVHTMTSTDGVAEEIGKRKIDVLISDLMLPGKNVFETFSSNLELYPTLKIVAVSGMINPDTLLRCRQVGVHGVVSKMGKMPHILDALKTVVHGGVYYSKEHLAHLGPIQDEKRISLSERELEITRLIAKGLSEKLIASELSISEKTVNNHKRNIFTKLGVQNQVSLVVECIRRGLIQNPVMENLL